MAALEKRPKTTSDGSEMYLCGVDIGGTFTDTVLIDAEGEVVVGKSLTTPGAFEEGVIASIADAVSRTGARKQGGVAVEIERVVHGTTIGTNAVVERKGAKTALVSTAGHGDTIHFMRANGRVAGLSPEEMMWASRTDKPDPIVPKGMIAEAIERVDRHGEVVVPLQEDALREALAGIDADTEAVAICLLWGIRNPDHEHRVREIVAEHFPDAFVTASVDLLPRWGEYERTVAAVINCYIGPAMDSYLGRLSERLAEEGLRSAPKIFRSAGGSMGLDVAARSPIFTLGSGPAAGIHGCAHLAAKLGMPAVIATDMGGTTFDVGLVLDGEPLLVEKGEVSQYEYLSPHIETRSIGSGGGSLVWVDERTGALKVGPGSAGADPGPACYGRGGTEPTVTDADLVLGRLNRDYFLGGSREPDVDAAEAALARIGEPLGLDAIETAAGALQIVDFQMAELTRRMTVQNGRDPREMVVFAYGGAGPLHAAVLTRELGAERVIVPLGNLGSVWSAFGACVAGPSALTYADVVEPLPVDAERLLGSLRRLDAEAQAELDADGIAAEGRTSAWQLQMKYRLQVHVLEIPVDEELLASDASERLRGLFDAEYERLFGVGTAYSEADAEIVGLQVRVTQPSSHRFVDRGEVAESTMEAFGRRPIYWREAGEFLDTPVYLEDAMVPGAKAIGPGLIELPHTSIAVDPGVSARVDGMGSIHLEFKGSAER
jgi:N-methylhydantoinase A